MSPLVIGTRGSALARWQAEHIADLLRKQGHDVELQIIVTEGDRRTSGLVDGKGVWVEEIEKALQARTIDLAVHSLKDVPAALGEGLVLAAIPPRADPRDALVGGRLADLPPGARVGTSSLRRVCQLRAVRPDLRLEILRGNVDTRLRKVTEKVVDAAVLACAGLDRLGFGDRIAERFSTDLMLPAIGQGALAIETRATDDRVRSICRTLSDPAAEVTVAAERALLARLGVGCRTPVAGHAELEGGRLRARGLVGRPDASQLLRAEVEGPSTAASDLGTELAERLLAQGADRILAELETR